MLRRILLPGGQELCYTLTRKAVKNINLRLSPEGDLRASASKSVPMGQIDAFVAQAGPRLLARRAAAQPRLKAHPAYPVPREGAVFWLLGRPMTLHLAAGKKSGALVRDGLLLTLPDPRDREAVRRAFRAWHKDRCMALFGAQNRKVAARCGRMEAELTVRDMKARWGSCHTRDNKITLNSRLLAAPAESWDYVLCHEYCHFEHPDHSARFYRALEQLLPEWQQRRLELRMFSPAGEPEEGDPHGI